MTCRRWRSTTRLGRNNDGVVRSRRRRRSFSVRGVRPQAVAVGSTPGADSFCLALEYAEYAELRRALFSISPQLAKLDEAQTGVCGQQESRARPRDPLGDAFFQARAAQFGGSEHGAIICPGKSACGRNRGAKWLARPDQSRRLRRSDESQGWHGGLAVFSSHTEVAQIAGRRSVCRCPFGHCRSRCSSNSACRSVCRVRRYPQGLPSA
jgi:hypothetical protein